MNITGTNIEGDEAIVVGSADLVVTYAEPEPAPLSMDDPVVQRVIETHSALDAIEVAMMSRPAVELPLVHRFTPGLYIREIFMPAGTLLTSKIHQTEHPYVVTKGVVSVWTEREGWVKITAPHTGITKPGTRRLLYIHEDTTWTTFHPTDKTDLAEIEDDLIVKHREHLDGLEQPSLRDIGVDLPLMEGVAL